MLFNNLRNIDAAYTNRKSRKARRRALRRRIRQFLKEINSK